MKQQFVLSALATALLLFSILAPSGCSYDSGILFEPPVIDDSTQVSFSLEIVPVFEQKCNNPSCHNTGAVSPDLTPDNAYDELIGGGYVDIDSPFDSELYLWLTGTGGRILMPPPNKRDDELINKVLSWISQGAEDN